MTQQQSNSIDEKNNSALFQNRNQESDFIAQMFPIFDSKDKKTYRVFIS